MVNKSGVITLLLIAVIGGAGAWFYWDQQQPKTFDELLAASKTSYSVGDYKQSRAYALKACTVDPTNNESIMMASFASGQDEKFEDAIAVLEEPNKDSEFYYDCLLRRGILQLQQGYATLGRESLEAALELQPMSVEANGSLFRLLRIEGRNWEARPYIQRLAAMGQYSANSALVMSMVDGTFLFEEEDKEFIERIEQTDLDYNMIFVGQAKMQIVNGEIDRGLRNLNDVLKSHPNQIEATAVKGFTLMRSDRMDEYATWRKELPEECIKHPMVWATLAMEAQKENKPKVAARCYWEALRIYPHHIQSCVELTKLLRQMDRKREATPFAKRGRLLQEFEQFLAEAKPRKEPELIGVAVERLTEMGRIPEAISWCVVGTSTGSDRFEKEIVSLTKKWGDQKGWLANKDNPAKSIDLSDFPLPDGITINYEIVDHEAEKPKTSDGDNNDPAEEDSAKEAEPVGANADAK